MTSIPFLKVSGSHFVCGEQIGKAYKEQIYRYRDLCKNDPPKNLSWQKCIDQATRFLEPTQTYLPEIVNEIKGVAKGSGMDFEELFALTIEEFYSDHYSIKACTDIIMLPPASEHTLVAHNNDLPPSYLDTLTSVEWNFDDGSQMFTVGLAGFMVSVGINNAKIVLSGNAVTPTDTRVGIPRALIARAILSAKTFNEATEIAVHPKRASSYNNIITTPNQAVSIEGSATDYECIYPTNGVLTHSNHYCSSKMLRFEGQNEYISSIERLNSANRLALNTVDQIDLKIAESFLSDHGLENIGNGNTICRHASDRVTAFGFAVDVNEGIVEITSGNPCQNPFNKVWRVK